MKIPKIVYTFGQIDDELIAAAAVPAPAKATKRSWVKWTVLAASLALVILAGAIALPMMLGGDDVLPGGILPDGKVVSFGDIERHYTDGEIAGQEYGWSWPEEYLTAVEKHAYIVWSFRNYVTSGKVVGVQNLGEKLGNYLGFEVREIQGAPKEHVIALGIEGVYYAYRCQDGYKDFPDTLGELNDKYNFVGALELGSFTEYENKYTAKGYYALKDDAYVLEVLADCRDAKLYVAKDGHEWERSEEYLSFTVTSDALGVYKKAMYITADGYLWTNVFEYAYIYEIGTEAAGKIIDYALTHSTKKETYEPYEHKLAGTVVEIKDGYVYIDDSIMCVDPDEGMVFRVSMEDIRIRRCIEYAGVGVGDLVVVTFRGGIAVEDGNLILDARSIDEGVWVDGDVAVPE